VLSAAARSVELLDAGTVFASMVFGHMVKYLDQFSKHIQRLGIPNVVLYVLDDDAESSCQALAQSRGFPKFCLRGYQRTALQKYEVVLAYLLLGRDVFWFDFDSIWLKNPVPVLEDILGDRRPFPADPALADAMGIPRASQADVLTAVDVDSVNNAMNAFFWVRSTEETREWLVFLLNWVFHRPYAHDQLAFATLLGIGPLVDEDPLPVPPTWAPLDPHVFANAARFAGLGFWGPHEDMVLFHFFDGWNSNQPDEVEYFATPIYGGMNLFEVLYGEDKAKARAAIERSRLEPIAPENLRDARWMDSLNLGVTLHEAAPVQLHTAPLTR